MKKLLLLLIIMFVFSCKKTKDVEVFGQKLMNKNEVEISGKAIIFLRPHSIKFQQNKDENGIYEADSDFGFAIQNTIDSLKKNPKFSDIKVEVLTEKFLEIKDCKGCPKTIDRDSIFYGVILTAPGKNIEIKNGIMSGRELAGIERYFLK